MAIFASRVTALAGAAAISASAANAQLAELVIIDLTVVDQLTVIATSGASAATVSGSDTTGIYLENFYSVSGNGFTDAAGTGDFTNFLNPSDGSPGIFRAMPGDDLGFNIWTWSSDFSVDFVVGTQAFTGTATFSLDPAVYADAIADGNRSGNLWFPADTNDDLAGATLIGSYSVRVPAPASAALLGFGGLAAARRRR
ncbi:MAG: VPLPA-CTERM sorting domain-containing protein [Planctomycetota bacterium]